MVYRLPGGKTDGIEGRNAEVMVAPARFYFITPDNSILSPRPEGHELRSLPGVSFEGKRGVCGVPGGSFLREFPAGGLLGVVHVCFILSPRPEGHPDNSILSPRPEGHPSLKERGECVACPGGRFSRFLFFKMGGDLVEDLGHVVEDEFVFEADYSET